MIVREEQTKVSFLVMFTLKSNTREYLCKEQMKIGVKRREIDRNPGYLGINFI